jgi:hypothetical protein
MNTHLKERPHHTSLFDQALMEDMATEAKHLIIIPYATTEANIMKAIITEANSNPALVMDPFNVGEIISKTTPINGASPFPHRPHGIITFTGDAEAVVASLLPWIDPEAKVEGVTWSWADSIEESLRAGESINFDALPVNVILENLLVVQVAVCNTDEPLAVPDGWTGESLMKAAFDQRQFQHSGVDRR